MLFALREQVVLSTMLLDSWYARRGSCHNNWPCRWMSSLTNHTPEIGGYRGSACKRALSSARCARTHCEVDGLNALRANRPKSSSCSNEGSLRAVANQYATKDRLSQGRRSATLILAIWTNSPRICSGNCTTTTTTSTQKVQAAQTTTGTTTSAKPDCSEVQRMVKGVSSVQSGGLA